MNNQLLIIAGGATAGIAEYVRSYSFRLIKYTTARDNGDIVLPPEPKFDLRIVACAAFLGATASSPFAAVAS